MSTPDATSPDTNTPNAAAPQAGERVDTPHEPAANPAAPIPGGPQPHVPQVDIPHMGTGHGETGHGGTGQEGTEQSGFTPMPQAALHPQGGTPQEDTPTRPQPDGVTQADIDAAIAQVEQTGRTDGLRPDVLAAACRQIEAQAARHGIDLPQDGGNAAQVTPAGPSNYVEAAVMDKQSTFDNFAQQRDALKESVTDQRQAARQPYQDALAGADGGGVNAGDFDPETVRALADALRDLDPDTLRLINAMGVLQSSPDVLKGLVWMEVVRALRGLIQRETQSHMAVHTPSVTQAVPTGSGSRHQ